MTSLNPLEEKWLTLAEVREDLGHNGFRNWITQTHTTKAQLQVIKGRSYVSPELVERYLQATSHPVIPRATKRPKGWLGVKRVREILECGASFPSRWATRGKLSAVQVKHAHFYDPESVERLRLELEKPLVGYVQISAFVMQARACESNAKKWLQRHGYPVKFFYVCRVKKLFTTQEGMNAWLEARAQNSKTALRGAE